jgi:predicted nucleotidyltransferase
MIDFPKLLRLLTAHDVAFIIIGGVAAVIHGSSRLTQDLDVVYQRSSQNLTRLVQALAEQAPYLRGAPPGLPFQWSVATLRMGLNFTLETSVGPLDLLGEITGGGSYEELLDHTIEVEVFGIRCRCLDLPALIRTKRAAGRPKDLEAIAELEVIWEEQQEGR